MESDPRTKPPKALNAQEQYSVLREIWGTTQLVKGEVSYVGMGVMDPDKPLLARNGHRRFNDQRAFAWPEEGPQVLAYLKEHRGKDLYFTANQFAEKGRAKSSARAERALWADLDGADPRKGLLRQFAPTIAWETSPGSFQAVWVLEDHDTSSNQVLSDSGGLNQRLNYAVGADKGGWASNKYLRVPGSLNCKPEYLESNGGNPYKGRLLWRRYRTWLVDEFDGLPELSVKDVADISNATGEMIDAINRVEVWNRVRMRVSKRIREFMALRTEDQVDDAAGAQPEGKSGVLWEIERELADAGCSAVEIVAIVKRTHWNKFAGRSNEITQLLREAAKAISMKPETEEALEFEAEDDTVLPTTLTSFQDLQRKPRVPVKWLIKDIWPEGACGFISGVPKSYKSFTALDFAFSIVSGHPFLGEFPVSTRGPVLLIEEEDNEALIVDRGERIINGKDSRYDSFGHLSYENGEVWHTPQTRDLSAFKVQVHAGFTSSESRWHDWLEAQIQEHELKCVIIDTLGTTLGMVDSYKSDEMNRKILRPLKQLSTKYNCAIIIIHHVRKANAGADGKTDARHGQDMMGAQALHAWVEASLYVYDKREQVGQPAVIYVARETKMETELKFSVKIPHMDNESNPLWRPEVNRALMDNVGIEQAAQREVSGTQRRNRAGTGGAKISEVLRTLGATNGRVALLADLISITGTSKQNISEQLARAVKNGHVVGNAGSGWTVMTT